MRFNNKKRSQKNQYLIFRKKLANQSLSCQRLQQSIDAMQIYVRYYIIEHKTIFKSFLLKKLININTNSDNQQQIIKLFKRKFQLSISIRTRLKYLFHWLSILLKTFKIKQNSLLMIQYLNRYTFQLIYQILNIWLVSMRQFIESIRKIGQLSAWNIQSIINQLIKSANQRQFTKKHQFTFNLLVNQLQKFTSRVVKFKILPFDLNITQFYYKYYQLVHMEPSLKQTSSNIYPENSHAKNFLVPNPIHYSSFQKFNIHYADLSQHKNIDQKMIAHQSSFSNTNIPLKTHVQTVLKKKQNSLEKMMAQKKGKLIEESPDLEVFKYQFKKQIKESNFQKRNNQNDSQPNSVEDDDVQIISEEQFREGDGVISSNWKIKNRNKAKVMNKIVLKREQQNQISSLNATDAIQHTKKDTNNMNQEIQSGQIIPEKLNEAQQIEIDQPKQKMQIQNDSNEKMSQYNFKTIFRDIYENESLKNMIQNSSNLLNELNIPDGLENDYDKYLKRCEKNRRRRQRYRKKRMVEHSAQKFKQNCFPFQKKKSSDNREKFATQRQDNRMSDQNMNILNQNCIDEESATNQWKVIGLKKNPTAPSQYLYKVKKQNEQQWVAENEIYKQRKHLISLIKFLKSKIVFLHSMPEEVLLVDD